MRWRWSCESAVWLRRLREGVAGVLQRPHQRRVVRHVQHVEPVPVPRRVQHADRCASSSDSSSPSGRTRRAPRRRPPPRRRPTQSTSCATRARRAARRTRAANASPPAARRGNAASGSVLRRRARRTPTCSKNSGSMLADGVHHRADHAARFVRRVAGLRHPPQAMQRDARDRVHHRGERRRSGSRSAPSRSPSSPPRARCAFSRSGAGARRDVAQLLQDRGTCRP